MAVAAQDGPTPAHTTFTDPPAGTGWSPDPTASVQPPVRPARFPGGLLIADRGNGRLLVVNDRGRTIWTFPVHGSLPRGQTFSADDAFVAPDGRTIVANDEAHQVIDRIDIRTRTSHLAVRGLQPTGSERAVTCTRPMTPIRSRTATSWSPTSETAGSSRSIRASASCASGAGQVRASITPHRHSTSRMEIPLCRTAAC